jgi:hypothetical protein
LDAVDLVKDGLDITSIQHTSIIATQLQLPSQQ